MSAVPAMLSSEDPLCYPPGPSPSSGTQVRKQTGIQTLSRVCRSGQQEIQQTVQPPRVFRVASFLN